MTTLGELYDKLLELHEQNREIERLEALLRCGQGSDASLQYAKSRLDDLRDEVLL